jgi:hypothetical protein
MNQVLKLSKETLRVLESHEMMGTEIVGGTNTMTYNVCPTETCGGFDGKRSGVVSCTKPKTHV